MPCLALEPDTDEVEESGLQEEGILGDCSGFDMLKTNVLDPHPPKPQLLTQSSLTGRSGFLHDLLCVNFFCSLEANSIQCG